MNVYLPDELAAEVKKAGLNLSAVTQEAVRRTLAERSTDAWLATVGDVASTGRVPHDLAVDALDAAGTGPPRAMAEVVVDASAMVDLLLDNELGRTVRRRLAGQALHAPAHLDAEVLSALDRLHRAGELEVVDVESGLRDLVAAPIRRHPVSDLLTGAWSRRHQLRLADALYVQLAVMRDLPLVTTDRRLRAAPAVDLVT